MKVKTIALTAAVLATSLTVGLLLAFVVPDPPDPPPSTASVKLVQVEGATLPTEVTAPGYSAVKLLMGELQASQIHGNEPRAAEWAAIMESRIQQQTREDLGVMVPGAIVERTECRTNTCRVTVALPSDGQPGLVRRALQLAPMGDATAIDGFDRVDADGKFRGTLYSFFDENRAPEKQAVVYAQQRRDTLQRLRPGQGRLRGISQVPAP